MNSIKPKNKIGLVARILSVPILLFTFFMAFAHIIFPDPHAVEYPPIENLLPVLMTLCVLGLAVAWRWERIGGAVTLLLFIVHLAAYWAIRGKFFPANVLVIFSPVFLNGILFIVSAGRGEKTESE